MAETSNNRPMESDVGLWRHVPVLQHLAVFVHTFQHHTKAPHAGDMLDYLLSIVREGPVVMPHVAQRQGTVTPHIDIPDLNVGLPLVQVVLARQRFAQMPVA